MRKGFLIFAVAGATLAGFLVSQTSIEAANGKKTLQSLPQFKQGEVVVKFKKPKGLSTMGMAGALAAQANTLTRVIGRAHPVTVKPLTGDPRFAAVKVEDRVPMGEFLSEVEGSGVVEYAEPNFIYHAFDKVIEPIKAVMPNDPKFNLTWGLFNNGQADPKGQIGIPGVDIGATKAWTISTGSEDMVVGVIDTGIDLEHEELAGNIYTNQAEIAGNGIDDDNNGFVDDVHGWNFVDNTNNPQDDHSHGTHVSGTIGAKGNNGIGVAGINWNIKIVPLKFLSADGGGSLDGAVEAIKYATKMKVKLTSNSWGGGGYSQALYDAIDEARKAGILFVAAAGNDGTDNDAGPSYPASYKLDNVISVGASDNRDTKPQWSNYGRKSVHLSAPGVNIMSTVPVSMGSYKSMSGTSMATPHVSGAAALLWSLNPEMTYLDVKARLLATVDKSINLKRLNVTAGRLNLYNALTNTVPPNPWPEPPADQWKSVSISMESKHPYEDNTKQTFELKHPGAKFLRVHFARVKLEKSFDFVRFVGPSAEVADEISGTLEDYTSEYVSGDSATLEFTTDSSGTDFGFIIDRYDFVE